MKNEKNTISVAPVKKYAPPKYPTQTDAKRSPDLLRKLPSRWEKNAKVVAAMGLLGVMSLTSCGLLSPQYKNSPTWGGLKSFFDTLIEKAKNNNNNNIPKENYLNVAPVFVHGNGTGSMGCVMIVPPVFMSEQEALAIIKNEAETAGLDFSAEPPDYVATKNEIEPRYEWQKDYKLVLGDGNVGLDLYDADKEVAVAYISMGEAAELVKYDGELTEWSSVIEYRPKELAELTVEDFSKQKGDASIGVLYEPGMNQELVNEYWDKSNELWEEYGDETRDEYYKKVYELEKVYEENIKAQIEEDLREQVRDFIEWLQGQGII